MSPLEEADRVGPDEEADEMGEPEADFGNSKDGVLPPAAVVVLYPGLVVDPHGHRVPPVEVRQRRLAGLPHPGARGQLGELVIPGGGEGGGGQGGGEGVGDELLDGEGDPVPRSPVYVEEEEVEAAGEQNQHV